MQKVRNEDTLIERATIRTPGGTLTQDFSINEIRPGTFMFACTKHPIQSPQDLELARKYEPKMPPDWPQKARQRVQRVKKAVGQDGIVGTWSPHGPYNNCSLLIDANTLYCLFLVDPGYYRDLINFAYERSLPYAKALDEAGVDVHCVGGNVPGGSSASPTTISTSSATRSATSTSCSRKAPRPCTQLRGDHGPRGIVQGPRVRIVEPFSPYPLGTPTWPRPAARRRGLRDPGRHRPGEPAAEGLGRGGQARHRDGHEDRQAGGKFIMQPVDFLEYGTPVENVEAYVKTALEHAAY